VESSGPTPFLHSPLFKGGRSGMGGSVGPLGGVFGTPSGGGLAIRNSRGSIASNLNSTASPEPIRYNPVLVLILLNLEPFLNPV